jgi:5'-nucleotidase
MRHGSAIVATGVALSLAGPLRAQAPGVTLEQAIRLAEQVQPGSLDLIVAGHTHQVVDARAGGIPIVEPGSDGTAIAVADLVQTPAGGREFRTHVEQLPANAAGDRAIAALVARDRERVDSIATRVVARLKFELRRDDERLGRLIAEANRNALRADVGLVNIGGIRADLPAGPVSYGALYEVEPFQNQLVTVTLSGAELREVLEQALEGTGRPALEVAGALVRYDPRWPGGRRIESVRLQGNRKLESRRRYVVSLPDYLAGGGDGFTRLTQFRSEPGGVLDLDALAGFLRRLPQPVEVAPGSGFLSTRR